MVEEVGTIVELKGKHVAMVMCQKSSACDHCPSSDMCHAGTDDGTRVVEAHNPLGAQVGDRVKVSTSTQAFLKSSFLLYVVPLIFLIVGAITGQVIGQNMENGPDPNLLSALIGVAFLAGSFLVIRVGTRALPKENYMPNIVKIIPPGGED